MSSVATTRRSRITPERESELYGAVLDLLREVGYDALTMDAVASRTRSSKATLYRQWGSKAELVVRALRSSVKPIGTAGVDTGSLRGDLQALADLCDDHQLEQENALMRGLVHAAHGNQELLSAFRDLLIEPEIEGFTAILRRAVDRGEISPDCPALRFGVHMMMGAFVTHQMIEDRPADPAFLAEYIDAVVLPALGA